MIGYPHRWQPSSVSSVLTVSYARVTLSASPLWSLSRYWNWVAPIIFLSSLEQKINRYYYRDVLLMQELLPTIHSIAGNVFVFQQDNAPSHREFFRFPKLKWLQLTGKLGKFISFWCQMFSGFHTLNTLKSVNLWQSYSKNKKGAQIFVT